MEARSSASAPTAPSLGPGLSIAAVLLAVCAVVAFVARQLDAASSLASFGGSSPGYLLVFTVGPYAALLGAAGLAVASGRRVSALAVPVVYVAVTWIVTGHHSNAILGTWSSWSYGTLVISTGLVVLPCAFVAAIAARRSRPSPTTLHAGALAVIAALVALVIVVHGIIDGQPWTASAGAVVVSTMAGIACSGRWHLLPFAVALPWLLHADPLAWMASGLSSPAPLEAMMFASAPVLIGAACQPLSGLLDRASSRPMTLLVAVNVLNLVDALATARTLEAEQGTEANPAVEMLGLPLKVAVGLGASLLVFRYRPRALLIPVVALGLVSCWHVAGLIL
jgi:hypothetical protein